MSNYRVAKTVSRVDEVARYLPTNYVAVNDGDGHTLIIGSDSGGWTLDGYVIPRLASGLRVAIEVEVPECYTPSQAVIERLSA